LWLEFRSQFTRRTPTSEPFRTMPMPVRTPLLNTGPDGEQLGSLRRENRALKMLLAGCLLAGGFVAIAQQRGSAVAAGAWGSPSDGAASFLLASGKADNKKAKKQGTVDIDSVEIPEYFDTRQEWLGCGTFVVDQGQCGDCWAASAANVFGDRVCIHLMEGGKPMTLPHAGALGAGTAQRMFQQAGKCIGNGTMGAAHEHGCKRGGFFVSPQPMVSCGNTDNLKEPTFHKFPKGKGYRSGHTLYPSTTGCNGGESQDAWRYLYHEGLSIMDSTQKGGCTPYTSNACSNADPGNNGCHPCEFSQCADTGLEPQLFTVHSFGWIMEEDLPERGSWNAEESFDKAGTDQYRPTSQQAAMDRQVRKMQIEMMTNGPLHTCIDDYANFGIFYNEYPQAVYNSTEGSPKSGGHCIELIGWGTDRASGMPYWTWKNSWGTNFANGGYARFIRGKDLLGIESDVWVGCPSGSPCELTAGVVHNETWVPSHAWFPVAPGYVPPGPEPRHPTSARKTSRSWPGGKEVELARAKFEHPSVSPLVVAAVRQATGDPSMTSEAALASARRVWTRSVRGLRLRVEAEGATAHGQAHRHMEGHITVGM